MKITMTATVSSFACAALAAPGVAHADEPPGPYSYAWHDSRMESDIGVSAILGGGVTGFTDRTMRDSMSSSVGGLWDLRVTLGSHMPLGLDVSYVGTGANINALIGSQSGTLIGTTVEAAVRYNALPHNAWAPYAFAGIGWQRYDITGGSFNLSDTGMNASDNAVAFPLGAGIAYRTGSGLVVDLRGTFRATTDSNLVLETPGSSDYAPMHTWEASAALGYEF